MCSSTFVVLSGKMDQNQDARKIWKEIKIIELKGLVINDYCCLYLSESQETPGAVNRNPARVSSGGGQYEV